MTVPRRPARRGQRAYTAEVAGELDRAVDQAHPPAGMAVPTPTVPPPERQALIRSTLATLATAAISIETAMGSAVSDWSMT